MSSKRALANAARRRAGDGGGPVCPCAYATGPDHASGCRPGIACLPAVPYTVANKYAPVMPEGGEKLPRGIRAGIRNWEPTLHRPDMDDPAPY